MSVGLRKATRLFVWIAGVLLVVATPLRAWALSCAQQTTEQQVDGASAVFLGRVTRNEAVGDARLVRFAVTTAFKGVRAGEQTSVWSESSKWQWAFHVGEEYVIFARPFDGATPEQDALSKLHTFVCMGDLKTDQGVEVVRERIAEIDAAVKKRGLAPASVSASASASAPASASPSAPPSVPPSSSSCSGCTTTAHPRSPLSGAVLYLALAIAFLRRAAAPSRRRRIRVGIRRSE